MDHTATDVALRLCADAIARHRVLRAWASLKARHWPVDEVPTSEREKLAHALWMIDEALAWPAVYLERKRHWLEFVQGILWATGVASTEEIRRMNVPQETV
jgi:hypothetical protein